MPDFYVLLFNCLCHHIFFFFWEGKMINQETIPMLKWWKALWPMGLGTYCKCSEFWKGDFLVNPHFLSPCRCLVRGRRALLTWSHHLVKWKGHFCSFFQGRSLLDQLRQSAFILSLLLFCLLFLFAPYFLFLCFSWCLCLVAKLF